MTDLHPHIIIITSPSLCTIITCMSRLCTHRSPIFFLQMKSVAAALSLVVCCVLHAIALGFVAPPPPMLIPARLLLARMSSRSLSCATPLFSTTTVHNNSTLSSSIPSNQELVSQRIQVARAKKHARRQSQLQIQERNLSLKRLFHTNSTNTTTNGTNEYPVPPLYAVKVSVCDELRQELKLNGRERRGRVFVQKKSDAAQTLKGLKQELHSFFRCLRKSTFILHASLPNGKSYTLLVVYADCDCSHTTLHVSFIHTQLTRMEASCHHPFKKFPSHGL